MKRLIALTLAAFLLLGVAMAYSGDVTITGIAADANSSNYTLDVHDAMVVTSGNSTNYTVTVDAYAFDVQDDIYVAPPPDDNGGSSSSRSSGTTFFPSTVTTPVDEPVEESVSFSSLVSTENESLLITSPRESDMFESLNISLATEMRNVQFRVVETVGATQRTELSLFKGEVYKLLDVTHDDIPAEDIINITLSFKVEKDWVDDRNTHPENVTLFRYDGFEWDSLHTNYSRTDANYYYFVAISPGLSTYVVGIEEEIVEILETNVTAPLITGNAVANNETNTSANVTNHWDDYEEPGRGNWVWPLLIIILVGGGIATFFVLRKKHEPVEEKPLDSPAALTINKKEKFPIGEQQKKEERPITEKQEEQPKEKEEFSFADEPETGVVEEAQDEDTIAEERPTEKPPFTDEDEQVLIHFIQTLFDKGFTIEQFKQKLVVKGWSEKQIDYCLRQLGK